MIIYGAGGHGKVIYEITQLASLGSPVFADEDLTKKVFNVETVSPELININDPVIIAIGNNAIRKKIAKQFPRNPFFNAVHPRSSISRFSVMEQGNAIMAGACINASSMIGSHNILNTNCTLDHDCTIADFVHISPGATLAGNVTVEEGVHVGIGANILPGVTIGKWAVVGAGAVVIANVPAYAVVVGIPARIIKFCNDDIN